MTRTPYYSRAKKSALTSAVAGTELIDTHLTTNCADTSTTILPGEESQATSTNKLLHSNKMDNMQNGNTETRKGSKHVRFESDNETIEGGSKTEGFLRMKRISQIVQYVRLKLPSISEQEN